MNIFGSTYVDRMVSKGHPSGLGCKLLVYISVLPGGCRKVPQAGWLLRESFVMGSSLTAWQYSSSLAVGEMLVRKRKKEIH